MGVSYKRGIGDVRMSPAEPLLAQLEAEGAVVDYCDPYVPQFAGRESVDLTTHHPADYDLCVIVTDHGVVEAQRLLEAGWRVLDTTNSALPVAVPSTTRGALERLGGVARLFRRSAPIEAAS
jgi:UDP-N-acetyl-D-glucosamine dehydrogenase